MSEVLLFHHVQGLTPGVLAFADELRAAGHIVQTPDLFDGQTFSELSAGMDHARQAGFGNILERGRQTADGLPAELIYAGFSMGVMPAQLLAQTRPGAKGALFLHAAIPPDEFGSPWPAGLPLPMHVMQDDELGDVDIAQELAKTIDSAELFLYPGDQHLFTDSSLPAYDEPAATLVRQRALRFLADLS